MNWRAAVISALILMVAACGDKQTANQAPSAAMNNITAAGEAAPLLEKWCTGCHLVPSPASHRAQEWPYIVLRMQRHRVAGGLGEITPINLEQLIRYFESHAKK